MTAYVCGLSEKPDVDSQRHRAAIMQITGKSYRLKESEKLLSHLDRTIVEIDKRRERLASETVDKDHLIDALTRFGSLWEVLVECHRPD